MLILFCNMFNSELNLVVVSMIFSVLILFYALAISDTLVIHPNCKLQLLTGCQDRLGVCLKLLTVSL